MRVLVVLCTCPDAEVGERIARTLVEERLAACVNRVPGIMSTYRWNGAVVASEEVLLQIKTRADCYAALQARLLELHPYDVPELLAIEPSDGFAPYLAWVEQESRPA